MLETASDTTHPVIVESFSNIHVSSAIAVVLINIDSPSCGADLTLGAENLDFR